MKTKDVNPKELAKGIKLEREHTNDPKKQRIIAMDHLNEYKDYYSKLEKAEKKMTKAAQIMKRLLHG